MNISMSFSDGRRLRNGFGWIKEYWKKMYGQEIDAYEKQESTNHDQDLNNFCLH